MILTLERVGTDEALPANPLGARNWARFADRMNYITNLFRSRQRDRALFQPPWTPPQEASLLDGRLPSEEPEKP